MRHLLISALSVLLLTLGCNRKSPQAVVPPLPSVKTEDVSAPANPTVTILGGSNLRDIAATAYGHEDFTGFVARLNGIADPERIAAGATLKTPSLSVGMRDAGLDPAYQSAVNVLGQSWTELRAALPDYERERDAAGARDGTSFAITSDLSRRLLKCADAMDAALDVLSHPKESHTLPRSTIGQFAAVSGPLRRFAEGRVDSRDYDVFMSGKGFGLGFTYALIWAQSHHQ